MRQLEDSMPAEASQYDDYDEENEYSPKQTEAMNTLEDMMKGDIRMKKADLDNLRRIFPMLGDRKKVLGLIKALYRGVGTPELQRRMSNAFDKRQADSKTIRLANALRKSRGEKEIEVKNKAVVPPKNLDFDD